jgi:hypothetical protein
MSKTIEELVIVGVIALLALKFIESGTQAQAQSQAQNSTLGQVAGYTAIGEGLITTLVQDF